MNYLAHMYLSCTDEDLLVGNMLVDMLPVKRLMDLPEAYYRGYDLHRLIDSYTDTHEAVKAATAVLRARHGKYSPVVIDILYDYVLSNEWNRYSGEDIQEFCNNVYDILERHYYQLPSDIVDRLRKMIASNYLMTCSTEEKLRKVFDRVGRRAKFAHGFEYATDDLLERYEVFRDSFFAFFPDMITEVEAFCDC